MEEQVTVCEKCGLEIRFGQFAFCPHGPIVRIANIKDEIPGGIIVENYGPHPIRFDSHSERRAYMKAHGLSERERFCPTPGTSKDPQGIPNPAGYMDDYTRNAGADLIRRNGLSRPEFDGVRDGVIRNLTVEVRSVEEAEDYARK